MYPGALFRNPRLGLCGGFTAQQFQFGDFTLDQSAYRLHRGDRILRLEKRPMELLLLLVERQGELVSREEIAERLWGGNVFLDVDHSINTAVGKVRLVLRDDPEKPRFVETVVVRATVSPRRSSAATADRIDRCRWSRPGQPLKSHRNQRINL